VLNSKYNYSFIPNKEGYLGVTVSMVAFLPDIATFLFHYDRVEREMYLTKYSPKREPYTSKIYLHVRFRLSKIQDVKEILSLFGTNTPTEILFVHDFFRTGELRRIENPSTTHPFFLKSDIKSNCEQIEYNKREFNSEKSKSHYLKLEVGKTGKKTFAYFDIDYAINLEDVKSDQSENHLDFENGLVAGELSYRFHFNSYRGGVREGTIAKGDDITSSKKRKADEKSVDDSKTQDEIIDDPKTVEENSNRVDLRMYDNTVTNGIRLAEENLRKMGLKESEIHDDDFLYKLLNNKKN
jgi:hypothetical protein